MKHRGTITIETERLILRRFTADDINTAFINWTSDEKVTEFFRWPTHSDISVTECVLKDWIAGYEKAARFAGIPFIYAKYGFGEAVEPDAIISNFRELPKYIAGFE